MSKDEIIADLRQQVATLSRLLEMALAPKVLASSTERTRRYRERHSDGHGNGHSDVTERESPPNGPLGFLPLRTPVSVTPLNPPKRETSSPRRQAPEDVHEFPKFWETYPRNNGSKKVTLQRWLRLSDSDRTDAVLGASNYAQSAAVLGGYVMYAEKWINGRFWEAWQQVEPSETAPNGDGPAAKKFRFIFPDGHEVVA